MDHRQNFFLDGKVDNIVYTILVKLVSAQSEIFGFLTFLRVQFL